MSFWKSIVAWTSTLAVAVLVYSALLEMAQGSALLAGPLASSLPGLLSGLLPFTVFAAACTFGARGRRRELWVHLLVVAALSYGLQAGLDPQIQHSLGPGEPIAVEGYGDLGPRTPWELIKRKRYIVENTPQQYSLDVDRPLATPPNWLDLLIHSPLAVSLFAVINGWLGAILGRRYPPGDRSDARRLWMWGILSGASFMIPAMAATDYVQASPSASGVGGAWFPLALPLVALLACIWLMPNSSREADGPRDREGDRSRGS